MINIQMQILLETCVTTSEHALRCARTFTKKQDAIVYAELWLIINMGKIIPDQSTLSV